MTQPQAIYRKDYTVITLKNHTFGIEKPQNKKKWNQICNANTQHRPEPTPHAS
jgi:hypothetical protein